MGRRGEGRGLGGVNDCHIITDMKRRMRTDPKILFYLKIHNFYPIINEKLVKIINQLLILSKFRKDQLDNICGFWNKSRHILRPVRICLLKFLPLSWATRPFNEYFYWVGFHKSSPEKALLYEPCWNACCYILHFETNITV